MEYQEVLGMLSRYLVLLVLPLSGLFLFYSVFTPLTVYPVFWVLKLWYANAIVLGTNTIFFKGYYAEIIPACIAGAAYYLLIILNLSTPMPSLTRVKSLVFLCSAFLVLNIARILAFARLFEIGFNYFDLTHQLTWYFGSTLLVVGIWFANVFMFNITAVPIYSDIKSILADVRPGAKAK
ncbi:MAG TPA: pacearchaeosortase [Candidatus Nanoarchaeia archaeon]|nr:pacearchaeosortase [Candidatus Nanoarchaeia archaeon]